MFTWSDQQNLAKEVSGLSDVSSVLNFKRDINAGTSRFLVKLGRPVTRQSRFASSVIGQQYYQLPEDAVRPSQIIFLTGTNIWIPLKEIGDEATWRKLNSVPQTGSNPTHFFVRGGDEFGIYPTPSVAVSDNIELVFEPRHVLLTADDYTTGTIAVTNGNVSVTGTGTVFTPTMANGSYVLQVVDGTGGSYYKITSYTNGTTIGLENYYNGITNATATYRIGQVSKIPEEYQEAPVDYAMYRHFTGKGELEKAKWHQNLWVNSLDDAESTYGMSTSNQIVEDSSWLGGNVVDPLRDSWENQIRVP